MRAHFVLAHPEPQSYNVALVAHGADVLRAAGWSVTVSDLYASGFDPCERPAHYPARRDAARFEPQSEQRYASEAGTLPQAVIDEIAALDAADLVVFQYPMWWHMPPAMLKGYFDRVFAYGEVYTGGKRFERGRFAGKKAMLSVTVGTSAATYGHDGRSGDIELMLWPVEFNLAYVGFTVLRPFVAYGVEAGLAYSDPGVVRERLAATLVRFGEELALAESRAVVPFNTMAEWGEDGRIRPDAPVYSAYVRRKKDLELE